MGVLRVNDGTVLLPDWRNVGCGGSAGTPVTHTDAFSGVSTYPSGPVVTDGITWLHRTPNYGLDGSGNLFWDGHYFDLTNCAGRVVFPAEGPDGSMTVTGVRVASGVYYTGVCWRVSSVASTTALDNYWCLRSNGDVQRVVGNVLDATVHLACGAIPNNATVEVVTSGDTHQVLINGTSMGSFTDSFNNTATGWGVIADNGGGFGQVTSATFVTGPPATTGRLELWDGARWMREVCTADTGTGPNLLTANQNGLETGATTGWAAQPDPGFGTVFTVISADTTHVHTGTYSLKVSTSAAIDRYFATPAGTSGFAVTPGTSYEVSAFVWRSDLSDASRLAFDVRWYNSSGSLLSTSTGFLTYITPREAWEPVDFGAYTAPAGAVYGQLYGHTSSANNLTITYWLDDIVIGANVERHPLRIEDPSSPGTWIDVACMTPA